MASQFFPIDGIKRMFSRWQWTRDQQSTSGFFGYALNFFGRDAVTIDVDPENCQQAYDDCPPLSAIIDRGAKMFANGEWKCVSVDNEEKEFEDDPGLALLKNPNPEQKSPEQFLMSYWTARTTFGNTFIKKVSGSALDSVPKALRVLPSGSMEIILTKKFYDQTDLKGMFKGYKLTLHGEEKMFGLEEVIYEATNFSYEKGRGTSKVPTLNLPINNVIAAYKTRNILIVNKGLMGFVGPEGKDGAGTPMPLMKGTDKEIEKQFERDSNLYSPNPKIKIVSSPVRWNQMGIDTNKLMLFEEIEDDFVMMCASLDMPKELFIKDATYENKLQAKKSAYEDNIIPIADSFASIMTKELGAENRGRKYILSYDWMKIMKEDEKKEAETEKIKTERLSKLWADNIISAEAYAEMAGIDMTGTGEVPKGLTLPSDNLGKIPLALQQLALAREREIQNGNLSLAAEISTAMTSLTTQLVSQAAQSE